MDMQTNSQMQKTTALAVLIAGVDVLRSELDRLDLPGQTITCFCHIAMRGELPQFDLIKLLGVSNAAVSRNITLLGNGTPSLPGPKLVEAEEDPEFRRRKLVRLTAKGQALVGKMLTAMNKVHYIKPEGV